jgi:hypothetical protein
MSEMRGKRSRGFRRTDSAERRRLVLMRQGDTAASATHTIGGRKREPRKASMPALPWKQGEEENGK